MRTWAFLALGMILFGSATPVSKILTEDVSSFTGPLLRVGIGAAVLLPFAWSERATLRSFDTGDWARMAAIAVFGMFGFSVLMLEGMAMIPGTLGAIVMATTPAVTATAAIAFLGESWRKVVALALSFAGVALAQGTGAGGGAPLLGAALVFAAVCCEATYTLVGRRVIADASPVLVACLAALMSIPLFLPFAWRDLGAVTRARQRRVDRAVWCGAGTLALGTWFWYSGIAAPRARWRPGSWG